MGASIYVHWPGCSPEQEVNHPGFAQDDHPYATWIGAVLEDARAQWALVKLGAESLLCVGVAGQSDRKMQYTSPALLRTAAMRLRSALAAGDPVASGLIQLYRHGPGEQLPAEELAFDLADIEAIADHAASQGTGRVKLLVGW